MEISYDLNFFTDEIISLVLPYFKFHQLCLAERISHTFQKHVASQCLQLKFIDLQYAYFQNDKEKDLLAKLSRCCPNMERIDHLWYQELLSQLKFKNLKHILLLNYGTFETQDLEKLRQISEEPTIKTVEVRDVQSFFDQWTVSLPNVHNSTSILLELYHAHYRDFDKVSFAKNGSRVTSFNCHASNFNVIQLVKYFPMLESLRIVHRLDPRLLEMLLLLPHLKQLNITVMLNERHFRLATEPMIERQEFFNTLLKSITLTELSLVLDIRIYNGLIDDICTSLINLVSLSLKFIYYTFKVTSFDCLPLLSKLRHLSLRIIKTGTSPNVRFPVLTNLTSLTMDIFNQNLRELLSYRNLRTLTLKFYSFDTINYILKILGRQLKVLELEYAQRRFDRGQITTIIDYCPFLTTLSLCDVKSIDDVPEIGSKLPGLTNLSLKFFESYCLDVSSLIKLVKSCPRLRQFNTNDSKADDLNKNLNGRILKKTKDLIFDCMSIILD